MAELETTETEQPSYDADGARAAGYTDDDVLAHLALTRNFDLARALADGHTKEEVADYLQKLPPARQQRGVLGKVYDWATKGLVEPDTFVRAITGRTQEQLDQDLAPFEGESPAHAAAREFVRGAVGSTARVASGFTSPVALGTMAAGPAVGALAPAAELGPAATGALRVATAAPALGFTAQGTKAVFEPRRPGETAPDYVERVLGGMGTAAAGLAGAAEAAGTGEAAPAEVGSRIRGALESGAEDVKTALARRLQLPEGPTAEDAESARQDIVRALPPSKSARYDAKADLDRAVPWLAAEHGEQPIAKVEHLRDAADSAVAKIEDHVARIVERFPQDTIQTDPAAAARDFLVKSARGPSFQTAGMKELQDFDLTEPKTLAEAEAIRQQLNAENRAVLKKNNYDVATARKVDAGFAAREAAAASLRDGVYDKLEDRGVPDVDELRRDEGALLKIRNAAENRIFDGDKPVAGTGAAGPLRTTARALVKAAATGVGAAAGGPGGAIAGAGAGEFLGNKLVKPNLTRDELVQRAFETLGGNVEQPVVPQAPPASGRAGARRQLGPGQLDAEGRPTGNAGPVVTPPPQGTRENPAPTPSELLQARSQIYRDPKTGRMMRGATGEPASAGPTIFTERPEPPRRVPGTGRFAPRNPLRLPRPKDEAGGELAPPALADFEVPPSKLGGAPGKGHPVASLRGQEPNAPFEPEPLYSITPNGFYSRAEEVARTKLPGSASGDQMLASLRNAGVKADELEWTGLAERLAGRAKVTRGEVLREIAENGLKVGEVVKGGGSAGVWKRDPMTGVDKTEDGRFEMRPRPMDFKTQVERLHHVADGGVPVGYPVREIAREILRKVGEGAVATPAQLEKELEARHVGIGYLKDRIELVDNKEFPGRSGTFSDRPAAEEEVNQAYGGPGSSTKWRDYTTPGGENYRELLLALPAKALELKLGDTDEKGLMEFSIGDESGTVRDTGREPWDRRYIVNSPHMQNAGFPSMDAVKEAIERSANDFTKGGAAGNYIGNARQDVFKSAHWSEPNVLAHVRFDERVDADGRKTLHVAEVQSDWHQQGRENGYRVPGEREALVNKLDVANERLGWAKKEFDKMAGHSGFSPEERHAASRELSEAQNNFHMANEEFNQYARRGHNVPDAPFKKTWHELALRRVVRWAAEHGFDQVTWDPGRVQSERYGLGNHVSSLYWQENPNDPGSFELFGTTNPEDEEVETRLGTYREEELPAVVGKELAARIVASPSMSSRFGDEKMRSGEASGVDLEIGGEGQKGFYDKIVPEYLNKLGKRYGARVGETRIHTAPPGAVRTMKDLKNSKEVESNSMTVPSFPITPAMRASVMRVGQPLAGAPGWGHPLASARPAMDQTLLNPVWNDYVLSHAPGPLADALRRRLARGVDLTPPYLLHDFERSSPARR